MGKLGIHPRYQNDAHPWAHRNDLYKNQHHEKSETTHMRAHHLKAPEALEIPWKIL